MNLLLEKIVGEDYAGEQVAPRRVALCPSDSSLILDALIARVAEFQQRRFPDQSVAAKMNHLKREADEVGKNPGDRLEWADVFLLLLGGLWKQDMTFDDLLIAAHQKMDINNDRQWGEPDADGVHHHIEEGQ